MENRITKLFGIKYPIIQAGMIWCSGWRLASAVSNAGGLGVIGAGSMYPTILEEHILKCKRVTNRPFAVNLPLLYPDIDKHVDIIIRHKVPIVFTSAGNPKTWTETLQREGIKVVHVISSVRFAQKCEAVGVDAIVAEGFEAGGHNGIEETTTFCLIPMVHKAVSIPVIAAGGIASGAAILAAMALGADGVQVGTRFVVSNESSAHKLFKNKVLETPEGGTQLALKQLTPVRLIKNYFYEQVRKAEGKGVSIDTLQSVLGSARAKRGMFEGDMDEGELEIGQISGAIDEILPAQKIVEQLWQEYLLAKKALQ